MKCAHTVNVLQCTGKKGKCMRKNPFCESDQNNSYSYLITLLTDGFVFVEELLAHPQFRSYCLEDVERIVATNDKQRFTLRRHLEDGRLQIRASQGHSIQVNLRWWYSWKHTWGNINMLLRRAKPTCQGVLSPRVLVCIKLTPELRESFFFMD